MGKRIDGEVINSRGEVIGIFNLAVHRETGRGGGFVSLGGVTDGVRAAVKASDQGSGEGPYTVAGEGLPRKGGDGIVRQINAISFTIPAGVGAEPVSAPGRLTLNGAEVPITVTPRVIFDRPDAESTSDPGSVDAILEEAAASDKTPAESAALYAEGWYKALTDRVSGLPVWVKLAGGIAAGWWIVRWLMRPDKKRKKD